MSPRVPFCPLSEPRPLKALWAQFPCCLSCFCFPSQPPRVVMRLSQVFLIGMLRPPPPPLATGPPGASTMTALKKPLPQLESCVSKTPGASSLRPRWTFHRHVFPILLPKVCSIINAQEESVELTGTIFHHYEDFPSR